MALITNFVSGAFATSGTAVAAGTAKHAVVRALGEAIIGQTGTRWAEVTGATPTPAFLQGQASTILAGSTGTAAGTANHMTLYLKDDAGLAEATPRGRLLRIWAAYGGVAIALSDITSGQIVQWNYEGWGSANTTAAGYYAWQNLTATNVVSTATTWQEAHRAYLFEDTNYLAVVFAQHSTSYYAGGFHLFYPEAPADGHITRAAVPPLFAVPLNQVTGYAVSNATYARFPQCMNAANHLITGSKTGLIAYTDIYTPSVVDAGGREFIFGASMTTDPYTNVWNAFGNWGAISGLKYIRRAQLAFGQEVSVGGVNHLHAGDHASTAGFGSLLKAA